jgi:Kip1 ubiquitination-promoting complex protein 1
VVLGTNGIIQIGWCTIDCPFTNEEGVGDAPDSFAYDGKRVKRWNVSCHSYGQHWLPGDVIGVCINLDGSNVSSSSSAVPPLSTASLSGSIEFFRNGISMGVAYNNVRIAPGEFALLFSQPGYAPCLFQLL